MKKNLMKTIAMLLGASMVLGGLVGCGEKKQQTDGKVTISLADYFSDPKINPEGYEAQMEGVKRFNEIYPDIVIEDGKYSFATDTYMAKAEAGTLPTVYYVPLTECEKIKDLGYAADLTKYFEENGFKENLNDLALDIISRDGKMYFVPEQFYYVGLFVNIDLYKKAGFVAEDGTLYQPTDWEDLARVAKEVKAKTGADGYAMPTKGNQGGWRFTPVAWSYGTVFEEKNKDGKWEAKFDTEECVNAVQFISDLKWKHDAIPANTLLENADIYQQFAAGNIVMTMGESSMIDRMVSTYGMSKDNLGVLRIPAGPERDVSLLGGAVRVIDRNATPEQIDAALKWLEFNGYTYKVDDETKQSIESDYQVKESQNLPIGIRAMSPWKDGSEYELFHDEMMAKYQNVSDKNVENYNNTDKLEFQVEEAVEAQSLYKTFDNVIQECLTNKDADIKALVSKAASDFQSNYLDFAE